MLPPMVVGGLLGVYLYTWLPEIFQLVLYVFTAILASCMGFKKGIGLWKSETEGASSAGQLGVVPPPCVTEDTVLPSVTSRARSISLSLKYKKAILITTLLAVWIAVILSRLLLGSSSTPSIIGIPYCTGLYWALSVIVCIMLMAVPGLFVVAIKSAAMLKLAVKLSGAMLCNATAKSSALVLGNIIGIGFIAALVGQGGGSLITPLLLYMELNPQQAAATGSVVMLITSSSLALSFGLGGFLPAASDMWIAVLPFFGALLGDLLLSRLLLWSRRLSFLALLLAALAMTGAMTCLTDIQPQGEHYNGDTHPQGSMQLCD
ncbi:conserved hypothetical protein [Perkinsus marinus ATCC 50983]|uniref:Sulfite exporter TauE/SafE n=1 Tax=Perkinsus marinus (strain ATCC 50983 / TXsc) TaxID=423536 RepID=C5K5X6_PERM5|nr:conserved hypothetical protein [Perkinsus marinus ATCC 50983]EER20137.1 conserved hypothetical protein [Perkinsus marinus ATCC 50983]|eukprot:XP_002788341.1 conserved hypothetical protein [Perkinsus marinus ATCC 50983]